MNLSDRIQALPIPVKQQLLERLKKMPSRKPVEAQGFVDPAERWQFYGKAREMIESTADHQVILSGPAETGKTIACCVKVHKLCSKYENVQAVIVRKTLASVYGSVLQTFNRVIAGSDVTTFGGEKPQWYDYPKTGSRVWIAGLDKAAKVLSSERDLIYANQAEELTLDDWETMTTRVTGRAGHVPHPQIIGDCNPGPPLHWIKLKANAGELKLLESRHEDNPTLFDPITGLITEQGIRSIKILDGMTGPRKLRLRYGIWAGAEGMIYEESWDNARNVIDRFDIPKEWKRYISVDFGFTNPFSCSWWAEDRDGRLYRYRQIYKTQVLVEDHARHAKKLSEGERIQTVVCDHDAEGRATFEKYFGMKTTPAKKSVLAGIQATAARLRPAGDGKPRLFLLRDSLVERDQLLLASRKPTCTEEEVDGYVWKEGAKKEEPVDRDNHGLDEMRYMVMYLDSGNRSRPIPAGSLGVGEGTAWH